MLDITELCEQVDQVGLYKLIVLDGAAQDVRGRLKEDVPHDEYIELIESLGRLNQCMLMWCQRLLPMHAPVVHGEAVCPDCGARHEEEA